MHVIGRTLWIVLPFLYADVSGTEYPESSALKFKKNPAPDGHRCGVCPTYFQKICAFDFSTNATYIFDNHCVMDLYNCMEGTGWYYHVNTDHINFINGKVSFCLYDTYHG